MTKVRTLLSLTHATRTSADQKPTQITTILFDCDNTLVLSETLAFEASADLTNEILARQKVPRRFTGLQLQAEFVGQSFKDMVRTVPNGSSRPPLA